MSDKMQKKSISAFQTAVSMQPRILILAVIRAFFSVTVRQMSLLEASQSNIPESYDLPRWMQQPLELRWRQTFSARSVKSSSSPGIGDWRSSLLTTSLPAAVSWRTDNKCFAWNCEKTRCRNVRKSSLLHAVSLFGISVSALIARV